MVLKNNFEKGRGGGDRWQSGSFVVGCPHQGGPLLIASSLPAGHQTWHQHL
jgi:hypothetical protein